MVAVMFTFSFGSAFAVSVEDAEAKALASAKEAAISALNNFVKLSDYNTDGQAEVREIIEEGTMLITYETEVGEIANLLKAYYDKLLAVDNANVTAVADAKEAAIEAIKAYIDALEATGHYENLATDTDGDLTPDYVEDINAQQTVVGIEYVKAMFYSEIEKADPKAGETTVAADAKELAAAKADAIKVVKGLLEAGDNAEFVIGPGTVTYADTDDFATITKADATKEQIAAYDAKVAEVVAQIKAATSVEAIVKVLAREEYAIEELAAETEIGAAQEAVADALYDWAYGLDYALYTTAYDNIVAAATNVTYTTNVIYVNGVKVTYGLTPVDVVVDEMSDVNSAVSKAQAFILATYTSGNLGVAKADAKVDLGAAKTLYEASVDALIAAEKAVDAAATTDEIDTLVENYVTTWRAAALADDTTYQAAVTAAEAAIKAKLAEFTSATSTAGLTKAANEYATNVIAELKSDGQFDMYLGIGKDLSNGITLVKDGALLVLEDILDLTDGTLLDYDAVLSALKTVFTNNFDKVIAETDYSATFGQPGYDKGFALLVSTHELAIENAKTVDEACKKNVVAIEAILGYEADADTVDARIAEFKAFKAAAALVDALPAVDEVTMADKDAVVAAYKAFIYDAALENEAYREAYPADGDDFCGEDVVAEKIDALYTLVDATLPGKISTFKTNAYNGYLSTAAAANFTAAELAAIEKLYADAVAAMGVAPDTGAPAGTLLAGLSTNAADKCYANDIDYIALDALEAMDDVDDKYEVEDFAGLIADAKEALGLSYNAADYSAAGLAKIAEIIATLDTATGARDLANKTIAARKAIAAVSETLEDEALNKALKDIEVKAYLQDLSVKARSAKTAKGNVKVTVVADV
ncbi:MAG: hypothetical protein IKT63_05880, partial [Oscillospiraceae bacterium]|nr:hypothetical protein [Oscillospiraceae bacterium]